MHGSNYSGRYPDKDNAVDLTGYGGPNGYFTGISPDHKSGTINFITPLAPGATDLFLARRAAHGRGVLPGLDHARASDADPARRWTRASP